MMSVVPRRYKSRKWRMWRDALLLVLPFTLLYAIFFIFPALRTVHLSFTDAPLIGDGQFVGLANFERLFDSRLFWQSLNNTFYFVLLTVIPNTALGLIFALMVVRLNKLAGIILAAFFLPFMLPVGVVVLIWQWLLDFRFGIIQPVFQFVFDRGIAVFRDPNWAMPMVALITVWWTVGFNMLLFIAGLRGISQEYYEAAALDGANKLQIFKYVTWPLLWPITALVLTLQLIAQLRIFDQIYLLTAGGPFNTTMVMLTLVYREGFQQFRGGYASAIALVLFIIILIASLIQYRVLRMGSAR